jgi:hypothetical protein
MLSQLVSPDMDCRLDSLGQILTGVIPAMMMPHDLPPGIPFINRQFAGAMRAYLNRADARERMPKILRPGDGCVKETLYALVAAAFLYPSIYPQHGYWARHGDHRYHNPAQLPHSRFRNAGLDRL